MLTLRLIQRASVHVAPFAIPDGIFAIAIFALLLFDLIDPPVPPPAKPALAGVEPGLMNEPRREPDQRHAVTPSALKPAPLATAEPELARKPEQERERRRTVMPSPPKPALAATEPDVMEQLKDELERRDAVIVNLLRRVEQLERVLTLAELDQTVAGGAGAIPSAPGLPSIGPASSPPPPIRPAQAPEGPQAEESPAAPATQAAPGEFEVDEEVADRALERTLVELGALLLPFGIAEIQPNFSYTRREVDRVFTELQRDEFEASLTTRLGLPFDSQLDVNFPYQYVDQSEVSPLAAGFEDARSGSGFGDIRVSLGKTLLRERRSWPDLVARAFWDTATGKSSDDGVSLNGDFNEIGGSLTALKRQDPLAFVGSVSYEHTFENDDVRPGDALGFSIGAFLAASPETSLRFLLNQSFADDQRIGGEVINGTDATTSTLSIGAASLLGRGVLVDISAAIGLTEDAPDYAVQLSVPIRFDLPIPGAR
ncbi:MAG: transporter [Gammaproteobacteria bacterium]